MCREQSELMDFSSSSYIINVRVFRNEIMKFDFVKQRLVARTFEVQNDCDQDYRKKCPSSASLVLIRKKWLMCGGKYH